jgi:pilus assembly protein CpaF
LDIVQAMTSGHAGSMSTLHANMAMDALNRLETLAMMAKLDLPLYALRAQIASAIDVIVQVTRFPDGRRGLTEIAEVLPLSDDGHYRLQDMFTYQLGDDEAGRAGIGRLVWSGRKSIYRFEPKMRILRGLWNLTKAIFQADIKDQDQA